jgi:hypothetical protein
MDSFVVRLWTPAASAGDPSDAHPGIHGTAHHVGSGRSATFRDGRELLGVLDELRRPPNEGAEGRLVPEGLADDRPVRSTRSAAAPSVGRGAGCAGRRSRGGG